MGFDATAFTMQLIQQLGQQSKAAADQYKETAFLNQFQNQLSQAQTPQEQLDMLLRGYLSGDAPQGARERMGKVIPQMRQFAGSKNMLNNQKPSMGKGEEEYEKNRAKSISDYVNSSLESRNEAEDMLFTIDTAKKAIQGDVAGPGLKAMAKTNPYTAVYVGLTPEESELQAANKKLLEGTKGLFGPKPTEREIFLLLNQMLPSIGKSKEANLKGLEFVERINDFKILKGDIIDKLTEGGAKFVPNIESLVYQQMKPIIDEFRKDLREATVQQQSEKSNQGKTKKLSESDKLVEQARKARENK